MDVDPLNSAAPVAPRRPRRWPLALLGLLAVLIALWQLWDRRPRVSQEEVRTAVTTTLQRETPAAFLVTGHLDLSAVTRTSSRTVLLPGILDLGVSSSETEVRVPARVSYGIDVRELKPEAIRVHGDSLVRVVLPRVKVHAVAPNLADLRIRTDRGWLRLPGESARRIERRALARAQEAMQRQADAHLRDSVQPRLNTARALERLLLPVLRATGMHEPRIEFELGEGVVMGAER